MLPDADWRPDSIAAFIEVVVSSYQIDRNRIYLIGYSMGGYGTWRTAARYPGLFAAIVPICGGGDPNDTKSIAHVPVWAFHGANDNVVPCDESERMIDATKQRAERQYLLCSLTPGMASVKRCAVDPICGSGCFGNVGVANCHPVRNLRAVPNDCPMLRFGQ
jgi:dienelactone hydrolase